MIGNYHLLIAAGGLSVGNVIVTIRLSRSANVDDRAGLPVLGHSEEMPILTFPVEEELRRHIAPQLVAV